MAEGASAEPQIMIGDRPIGAAHPCYVIAEIGVNHNGDVALAEQLIEVAAEAGADAVKFQTFRTASLVTTTAQKAEYQERQTGAGGQAEMLAALELVSHAWPHLRDRSIARGLDFISTAFDARSLAEVIELGPKCLKWPSGELNNVPLLRQAAAAGLPIILSTGMAELAEVDAAVALLRNAGLDQVCVLQCVSNYPAPLEEQNLRTIPAMSARYGLPAGLSDHTAGSLAALVARGLGMAVLEKHITLDRSMPGPDHAASIEPAEFAAMVANLRTVEAALGDGVKRPMPSELATRKVARRSLVYSRPLTAGHLLTHDDLDAKRPAGGVAPSEVDRFVGRRLSRAVEADQQLDPADVS